MCQANLIVVILVIGLGTIALRQGDFGFGLLILLGGIELVFGIFLGTLGLGMSTLGHQVGVVQLDQQLAGLYFVARLYQYVFEVTVERHVNLALVFQGKLKRALT